MNVKVGILGDPAKIELYDDQFYSLLKSEESSCAFHLLGASENDVTKHDYDLMFQKFSQKLKNKKFEPIRDLSPPNCSDFTTRIGLFPSSSTHLINGPSFAFAPYPINSRSNFLKFKSKVLTKLLTPFTSQQIIPLAYSPLGGKAAEKSKALKNISNIEISKIFYNARKSNYFKWFYLEAGSGQNIVSRSMIESVLKAQSKQLLNLNFSPHINLEMLNYDSQRVVVPKSIYGGGIKSLNDVTRLLEPKNEEPIIVPEAIIIGNVSEDNITMTYRLVEKVHELNHLESLPLINT